MKFALLLFSLASLLLSNALQDTIDTAKPYSTLRLSSGIYKGNISINKPLNIVAKEPNVVIEGNGDANVVTVRSSYVTLKNLTIRGSGERMDRLDAAISITKAKHIEVIGCRLLDTLYGIDMNMVSDSNISNNYITSKKNEITLRGNALKLYYAHNNLFVNNTIEYSRDVTLNYSHNNLFEGNSFEHNRFASHLSLSNQNVFKDNSYKYNSVSIMIMGAKDTNITNNSILSSNGAAGIGVVVSGVKNFVFEHNTLSFNAKGLYIDGKEKHKGMKRFIKHNEISYNGEALHFHASIKDNTITHNKIFGNIDDVVKDVEGSFGSSNVVEYNYWDRYAGFDRDGDGIGDNSHQVYQYADQLWHYNNKVKFFYASPIMSLLNFLSNLAPFVEPNLIMEDEKPVF
jgi:nitrous oxidase accessory protein